MRDMSLAFLSTVQACALDRWSPQIGDPSVMGWVTVAVYVLAGSVALATYARAPFPRASYGRERVFWLLLGLILLALAVNKQLDLQSWLTAFGRCVSKEQGWYQDRRSVQAMVVLGLIAAMLALALALWRMMRGTLTRSGVALLGLVFVLGFVAVRAVGFHHVDALINLRVSNLRLNWLFELTGPTLVILNGLWLLLRRRRRRTRAA
jgi:hypothetical protein